MKFTIGLRKEDESAYINPKTFWYISRPDTDIWGVTYELQVKHDAVEDVFKFFRWVDGDACQLLDGTEYVRAIYDICENEGNDTGDAVLRMARPIPIGRTPRLLALEHEVDIRNRMIEAWMQFRNQFNPQVNY